MRLALLLSFSAVTAVSAAPVAGRQAPFEVFQQAPWNAGAITEWQIHPSCNASARLQLSRGLAEAVELASHAKEHILRWGNSSEIYQKYFGNRPTVEAIGSLDVIVNGDKARALFRCDDPDGNCASFPTWAGHWRGDNATDETVICPTSFAERKPLTALCAMGYNVREGEATTYWASDLVHRLYHLPAFGQGYVDHYAEGWDGIIEQAAENSPNSTHDSDGLQYFALESYAHDLIYPGMGCPGPTGDLPAATSSTEPAATSATSASATSDKGAGAATSVPQNCHTHSDGAVHCDGEDAEEPAVPENCHTHADGAVHCT